MKKQLLLFHNASCAFFSGNQQALEQIVKNFHAKLETSADEQSSSFLESEQQ
jgi:hypothetical protein